MGYVNIFDFFLVVCVRGFNGLLFFPFVLFFYVVILILFLLILWLQPLII
jgi:hypothetical protein